MGGASRNEKRRKQEAAEARLAAAGITPPPSPPRAPRLIVIGLLSVAALIGVGFWIYSLTADQQEPVAPTYAATYTATPDGGAMVVAGNGPVAVDVYSDYLCPLCERFASDWSDDLTTALNEGRITVNYHAIAILDNRTDPPGFATRAANAAMCAGQAGVFPAYQQRLYDEQPREGGAGLSDAELIAFGADAGAQGAFAECVTSGAHTAAVTRSTQLAASNPALINDGNFGTPTVAIGGAQVNWNDPNWLRNATGG